MNLVYYQPNVGRPQQMADNEHITEKDEKRLTENWRSRIIILDKYKAQRDELRQLLYEPEYTWE